MTIVSPASFFFISDVATYAQEVLAILSHLNRDCGKTIVMVTHNPKVAQVASVIRQPDKGLLLPSQNNAACPIRSASLCILTRDTLPPGIVNRMDPVRFNLWLRAIVPDAKPSLLHTNCHPWLHSSGSCLDSWREGVLGWSRR